MTKGHASEEKAAEIKAFFDAHPCPPAARNIEQALESVHANAAWVQRDKAAIAKFLSEEKLLEGYVSGVF